MLHHYTTREWKTPKTQGWRCTSSMQRYSTAHAPVTDDWYTSYESVDSSYVILPCLRVDDRRSGRKERVARGGVRSQGTDGGTGTVGS